MRYKQNKFAIMKFAKKRVSEKSIIYNIKSSWQTDKTGEKF